MTAGPLALVLSGGGARGAFEVGVLAWIAEHRPDLLAQVRVVTGASVGAVNAAFLASRGLAPESVGELEALWTNLHVGRLLRFSAGRLAKVGLSLGRQLRGDADAAPKGLFDTSQYEALITEAIDWDRLHDVVERGRLDAFAVVATEIGSGQSHVFVSRRGDRAPLRWPNDRTLVGVQARIAPEHVLASTSLPFIFSPVQVGPYWYTDGGLRQNVPLSPALRLGAKRVLTVVLKQWRHAQLPEPGVFPGFTALAGKLLNGIFIDRMKWDLDRLNRINALIESGSAACGEGYLPRLHAELAERGRRPYEVVRYVGIQPTADLGALAADLLLRGALRSEVGFVMRKALARPGERQADLASYLLFDGAFAGELIRLGREAAAHCAADLDGLAAA